MNRNPSLARRMRYSFDNTLSHGPAALILWLVLATVTLILLAVGIDILIGGISDQMGLGPREVFWNILFQALVPNPPGNFDSPWQFLIVMLTVTIASLAMVSILIGLLSASIQDRLETLRRGRSQIIESNHTVILGWAEQIFPIISELVVANANQRRSSIAVLGDIDKVDMEEEIRQNVGSTGRTRVVVRRGSPMEHADLNLVSPQTSKSIIILPNANHRMPDADTIKTILALTKAPDRRPEPYNIVAVLRRNRNQEIAQLVGGDEVELVLSGDVIARIMAQTCRQAGLSIVYTELFDFEGDEIYFQAEPTLEGKTFGEALLAYEDSAIIGIDRADGTLLLAPPMDTVINAGDRVIAISEDDDTVRVSGIRQVPLQAEAIETGHATPPKPERTLILGWNWRGGTIVRQLDAYVAPGSLITVAAEHVTVEAELEELKRELKNTGLHFTPADITSREMLDGLLLKTYNHIIVLAYSDTLEDQQADAITLLALLRVRGIAGEQPHTFSLVSEMMDLRNRELAESARADDFIVSDRLVGLIMTQVSENKALNRIFNDLLDPEGVEIYLKPASDYIKPGATVSFYTVVQAAGARGEVAIGYRIQVEETNKDHAYGVVVNPDKSKPITFVAGDRVIVLAES